MVTTLAETNRMAIATKLADMKELQNLLISNEVELMGICSTDMEIKERLKRILEDDRENLGTIDRVITKYGVQAQPHAKTKLLTDDVRNRMTGTELTLYEKVTQHEALTHELVMTGLVVHKAAQVVGEDVQEAIAPLYKVNFKNRAHQEQLKSIVQVLGTRELTGQNPDNSIWGQADDAIAALKGIFGGLSD
jgi:hypothetical protein